MEILGFEISEKLAEELERFSVDAKWADELSPELDKYHPEKWVGIFG